jgi:hypothetical protein
VNARPAKKVGGRFRINLRQLPIARTYHLKTVLLCSLLFRDKKISR